MGYRTVVILHNDQSSDWEKNPKLGEQISRDASMLGIENDSGRMNFGSVVECVHADCQTLGIFDSYGWKPLAQTHWSPSQNSETMKLELLKKAAEKLGYTLHKKPASK